MEATNVHPPRISEFGTLDQSLGFRIEDTNCLNLSYIQNMLIFTLKYGASLSFGSLKGVNPVDQKINQIKRH
uniref:Uncharacterized protein n=1 Tax=Glycine max TaxID=3847 RepID=C6TGI4_SOYBN|nr:unknown [Glycine max]